MASPSAERPLYTTSSPVSSSSVAKQNLCCHWNLGAVIGWQLVRFTTIQNGNTLIYREPGQMPTIGQHWHDLNSVKFLWAKNQLSEAKTGALRLVTALNTQLKATTHTENASLKELCIESIEVYQKLKAGEQMSVQQSLLWLSSNFNGVLRPPVGDSVFVDAFVSLSGGQLSLSMEQNQLLSHWIAVESSDWSTEGLSYIYQDFLQDCSFVTALMSLARQNSGLLLSAIAPHSDALRYGVTFNFNGCQRLIEIDNTLPVLKDDRSLFIKSRTNDRLLWPALLEKAYLTLMGHGYDSHGSNACIDTFIISGWIPEFVTAQQRPDMEGLWEKLYTEFQSNGVVLSLGTGEVPSEEYAANHDYSVTEMIKSTQTVIIKNPWRKNITVMKFTELFDHFETLYLNWNPDKYQHKSIHCIWNNQDKTVYHSPQFEITNTSTKTCNVKVLLEKHMGTPQCHTNISIYKSHGERLFQKTIPLTKSTGNNTGFVVSTITLTPGESCTAVVYCDSIQSQTFTLHTYTTTSLTLQRAQHRYPHIKSIEDSWTIESCGGNWSHQSYTKNPQYELVLPEHLQDVDVQLALYTKGNTLINAQLFFEDHKPFTQKPSIIQEKYQQGHLITHTTLEPGKKYKLVLSTYEPDIHTSYKLVLNSTAPLSLTKISTRLGLFIKSFTFTWNNKNRFRVLFTVSRETEVRVHLWTSGVGFHDYRPKIRASLFYRDGTPIQINQEFDDCLYGIWTDTTVVKPGQEVILLVERFEMGEDDVMGEIGSNYKVELAKS